jgi:hypothetical protein
MRLLALLPQLLTTAAAAAAASAEQPQPQPQQPLGERPWLDASKTVDERTALLLAAMTLEEKAAQLWQTNYMGGVNASTGFPGVNGNQLGNESTRLAYMVRQLRCEKRLC